jgi:hypothetical protein
VDIKYDASGQPLPFEQQQSPQPAQAPQPKEPILQDETQAPDEIQLANPFVAEFIRSQQQEKSVRDEVSQPDKVEPDTLKSEYDESEPLPAPAKQDHPNFRALRQAAEKAERERDEYFRLWQEQERRNLLRPYYAEASNGKQGYEGRDRPVQQAQPEEPDDLDVSDDGFVEPKHLKKVHKAAKQAQRELAEYKQQVQKQLQEAALYRKYPDIDRVVSPENIAKLAELKPAYARQLADLNERGDIYGTGELAYHFMLDLGIVDGRSENKTTKDSYASDRMRAQNNAAKPRPVVSGVSAKAESPLARAHAFAGDLNDADMNRHYQEMEAAIRNRMD